MQPARLVRVVIALLSLGLATASVGAQQPQLVGTLEIVGPQPARHAAGLQLRATVRNDAHQTWCAPVVPLSIAQLSVDVYDPSGRRVPTIPPPVPRPDDDRCEPLEQGRSRTFVISLGVFSPDLAPGTYTVRWGAREGIATPPATFVIAR
ncbi:hypothetical protein [Sandaracinus amylolyticus]|uniref:hypothetical protein n=1 Tax=Sandaracinus amylolyticus TaxID=927083 RepID=UPI001F42F4C7|nr:hypothetical protein [Sandaracinus amylolyticus]UJR83524.1 Hypothetical protein I5071_55920 [Sandaracinus amylolyticus]